MLQNYNKLKVARVFFESPTQIHQLREISRKAKLSPLSTKNYLRELQKEEMLKSVKGTIYPGFQANRESDIFKYWKKWSLIAEFEEIGLLKEIEARCLPTAIILFGSASRGEDIEQSDLDLAVFSQEKEFDISKYEKNFKRKISLHFYPHFERLESELKNNILNGIKLSGYIKVF